MGHLASCGWLHGVNCSHDQSAFAQTALISRTKCHGRLLLSFYWWLWVWSLSPAGHLSYSNYWSCRIIISGKLVYKTAFLSMNSFLFPLNEQNDEVLSFFRDGNSGVNLFTSVLFNLEIKPSVPEQEPCKKIHPCQGTTSVVEEL